MFELSEAELFEQRVEKIYKTATYIVTFSDKRERVYGGLYKVKFKAGQRIIMIEHDAIRSTMRIFVDEKLAFEAAKLNEAHWARAIYVHVFHDGDWVLSLECMLNSTFEDYTARKKEDFVPFDQL